MRTLETDDFDGSRDWRLWERSFPPHLRDRAGEDPHMRVGLGRTGINGVDILHTNEFDAAGAMQRVMQLPRVFDVAVFYGNDDIMDG